MTIAIATVATPADLADEIGGQEELDNLELDQAKVTAALTNALADVLAHLDNKTPPVAEGDISDPTQLKRVTVYGALTRLYLRNVTTGDGKDRASKMHAHYSKMFGQFLRDLRPKVSTTGGTEVASGGFTIAMHRR